ncbi:MAG: hypothetical protein IPL75_12985 [Acidobacteria bacterium]|jgi:hypothetical protein|nr:hypothetical protein [Acidobacteriota bacterium]
MSLTFDEWAAQVDVVCTANLACSWNDLCGEVEPLRAAFDAGESPVQFVLWWAEKYDLMWLDGAGMGYLPTGIPR